MLLGVMSYLGRLHGRVFLPLEPVGVGHEGRGVSGGADAARGALGHAVEVLGGAGRLVLALLRLERRAVAVDVLKGGGGDVM